MSTGCVFCEIAAHRERASIVFENELTMAFIDLRQFHAGHTLVIPRRHFHDVGELDPVTGGALMASVSRVTRAVRVAFPNQGVSVWSSIGPAAFQEVPHVHIHVHPRLHQDGVMEIYPSDPPLPDRLTLDSYAARLRVELETGE